MKRKLQIIIGASAASALVCSALAQGILNPKPGESNNTYYGRTSNAQRPDRLNAAIKASDLIGMTVKNYQGEKLGKVADLALNVESGRITQVILSSGGFLGIDATFSAVPPGALHCDGTNKVLQLDASKEKFNAAPKFDSATWDEGAQSNQLAAVYGYYGQQPNFTADRDGYGTTNLNGTFAATMPRDEDGTNNLISDHTTWTRGYYSNNAEANHSWARLGHVQKASKFIGSPVDNLQDEKLGQVENLMVDLSSGRIVAVIISSGGMLNAGNELSAVPPAALRFDAKQGAFQLNVSKEMLANASSFKSSEWPDFSQPDYVSGIYRAYNVEPYFNASAANGFDNTASNVHGRNSRTLTPFDQGNSQADVNTTAQIRKEILADKGMSINARNVKIITIDGQVTLSGQVNTATEKRLIGEIAERIARAVNVDNRLEVQITTSSN